MPAGPSSGGAAPSKDAPPPPDRARKDPMTRPVPSLPPETEAVLAAAAEAAAAWPARLPSGSPRRERLTIANRPQGPCVVEWVGYAHRRIRQGFVFIGPARPAIREPDSRPGIFLETAPPSAGDGTPAGVLVRDATLALFLSRDLPPVLTRRSDAALPDLGVVGHPDLDGPGGASGTFAHALTLGARAAAARLPDGLHPLLDLPGDSAHQRVAAAAATALLPEGVRETFLWGMRHRDADWRPAFLVSERAAVLLMLRPGRIPRHLASAALRR